VVAEPQLRVPEVLERGEPYLLQAGHLGRTPPGQLPVLDRVAGPQRQPDAQPLGGPVPPVLGEVLAGRPDLVLEAAHVDLGTGHGERVACAAGEHHVDQPAGAQRLTYPGDVAVQGLDRGTGWLVAPERVDQPSRDHHGPGLQREQSDERALPTAEYRAAQWPDNLDRTE